MSPPNFSYPNPANLPPPKDDRVRWHYDLLEEGPDPGGKREGCVITRSDPVRARDETGVGDGDRAVPSTYAFESIQAPLLEILYLLPAVESRMVSLKESFNDAMPPSLLRLRPWPRYKGGPPYALYWIYFRRRRPQYDSNTFRRLEARKPCRFRRLKIKTRADLSDFIHLARLDLQKRGIFDCHDRALALNEAHKVLARVLDSLRKIVNGKAAQIDYTQDFPDFDPTRFIGFGDRIFSSMDHLWRLGWTMRSLTDQLRDLAEHRRQLHPRLRYKLVYLEDSEHPYGRLIWRDDLTRTSFSSLSDRHRRRLHIPKSERIADFERTRRELTKRLQGYAGVVKRIRLKLGYALKTGRAAFDRGRVPLTTNSYREVP
jgi:hypothetical protein